MSWLDEYQAPHFRSKIPFNWRPLVFWLVLILVIAGSVYYFMTRPVTSVIETPIVEQTTTETPIPEKPVFKSEAPSFDTKCTVVAGVIPGSIQKVGNVITFTFKNNGKFNIEGSYFEASNGDVKAYRKNSDPLVPDSEATYAIDLDDVSTEVGIAVKSFVILPVQNSKACLNQRMIVIG